MLVVLLLSVVSSAASMSTWDRKVDAERPLEIPAEYIRQRIQELKDEHPAEILEEIKALVESERELEKIRSAPDRYCPCYCRKVGESQYKCCDCDIRETTCFPGQAEVVSHDGDVINMADLKIGDDIMTVADDGSLQKTAVLSFLHYDPDVTGVYLDVKTSNDRGITLSPSHLIYASDNDDLETSKPRYASSLERGENVFYSHNGKLESQNITSISHVLLKGAYVPLTSTGTLIVDGFFVSCYASFDHYTAHLAMTPVRLLPWLFNWSSHINGVLPYVHYLKIAGRSVLPSSLVRQQQGPTFMTFKNMSDVALDIASMF